MVRVSPIIPTLLYGQKGGLIEIWEYQPTLPTFAMAGIFGTDVFQTLQTIVNDGLPLSKIFLITTVLHKSGETLI